MRVVRHDALMYSCVCLLMSERRMNILHLSAGVFGCERSKLLPLGSFYGRLLGDLEVVLGVKRI